MLISSNEEKDYFTLKFNLTVGCITSLLGGIFLIFITGIFEFTVVRVIGYILIILSPILLVRRIFVGIEAREAAEEAKKEALKKRKKEEMEYARIMRCGKCGKESAGTRVNTLVIDSRMIQKLVRPMPETHLPIHTVFGVENREVNILKCKYCGYEWEVDTGWHKYWNEDIIQ